MQSSSQDEPISKPQLSPSVVSLWTCFGLLGAYALLLLGLGEEVTVIIHDQLDSEFVWRALLAQERGDVIPQIMGGLPREAFPSDYNLQRLPYLMLPARWALICNELILRAVAFGGVLAIGERLLGRERRGLVSWVALTAALTPAYYSVYGLSVSGQALLWLSALKLYERRAVGWAYLYICCFAFYSSLVLVGVFVLGVGALALCVDLIKSRRLHLHALGGWLTLLISYSIAERPLISLSLSPSFTAHRVEFIKPLPSHVAQLKALIGQLSATHYHTGKQLTAFVVLSASLAWWGGRRAERSRALRHMTWVALLIGLISCFVTLYPYLVYYAQERAPFFAQFQFSRVYFLLPSLWWLASLLSLGALIHQRRARLARLIVGAQLAVGLLSAPQLRANVQRALGAEGDLSQPSFRAYFSEALFDRVKATLPPDPSQYRVIGLGISPSILQYHGLYTLDGYQNLYPLSYKHQLRAVMSAELEKSERWRRYYDLWGNRAYLFAAELPHLNRYKHLSPEAITLSLNSEALRALGGRYVISAVKLTNPAQSELELIGSFTEERAPWELYVYQLIM